MRPIADRDHASIWHPYTHFSTTQRNVAIVSGQGAELVDETGKTYIDAIGSWWVNLHGHAHPYIAEKVAEQFKQLEHVIFAGFTHPGAVDLAERILELVPGNKRKVFYSDNGSTSTEVALKMAIKHRVNEGVEKHRIAAFTAAYHGDTFGAMSVGARGVFNRGFDPMLFPVDRIPVPVPGKEQEAIDALKTLAATGEISAFIFEPLLLAAGGMQMYSPEVLDELVGICHEHGIIAIADEVVTGFGRTGPLFACEQLKNQPDIVCLAKGLTGGSMTMGMTVVSERIWQAYADADRQKTFYHGHSFTGNPLACAAALASLDLLLQPENAASRERIRNRLETERQRLIENPLIANARRTGSILAFEVAVGEEQGYLHSIRDWLYAFFVDRGILVRPLGNTISLVPPYCTTDEQLDRIFAVVDEALETLHEEQVVE